MKVALYLTLSFWALICMHVVHAVPVPMLSQQALLKRAPPMGAEGAQTASGGGVLFVRGVTGTMGSAWNRLSTNAMRMGNALKKSAGNALERFKTNWRLAELETKWTREKFTPHEIFGGDGYYANAQHSW